VGIPPGKYISPEAVKAKPGKNVIVIYMESLEKGFLREDLTPNLSRLAKTLHFAEMPQGVGSDWSAASFYTGISGIPAFFSFGSGGNSIFQNTKSIALTGTGHVFEAAGYQRVFMLGNKAFAGMDEMLSACRFKVKSEVDFGTSYAKVPWGIHDLDLFKEAKKEVKSLKGSGRPFALYLATVSSHGPEGFYDPRVETMVPQKTNSNLEKMVAATDAMVGDFVQYLTAEGLMDNTVIYLMPDHLLMGDPASVDPSGAPRSLYLITNAKLEKPKLEQIDLPRTILQGAGIDHNAVFLKDFLPEGDSRAYLLDRKRAIQQLNEASVGGENFTAGFRIVKNNQQVRITATDLDESFMLPAAPDQVVCLTLDHKFRITQRNTMSLYEAFYGDEGTFFPRLIIGTKAGYLYSAIRYGNKKIVSKKGREEILYTRADIELLREWPYSPEFYELPQYPVYHSTDRRLYITSSAAGAPQIKTPTEIRIDDRNFPLGGPGIYGYFRDNTLRFFDPNSREQMQTLKQEAQNRERIRCLLVHQNGAGPYNDILAGSSLVKLSNLGKNMAYIAYPDHGLLSEHVSPSTISFSFLLGTPAGNSNDVVQRWGQDRTRFIAHGGGGVDGIPYTNSLEALNLSYSRGFRMFELDIQKTTDGVFVAAHDWLKWHQMTGTDGQDAVSHQAFSGQKLMGKYTPLDIDRINDWFRKHPDAILVTDKINEPQAFSRAFAFPDRLIMELFSQAAVLEAAKIPGVQPMVSENVLKAIPGNKVEFLKTNRIDRVAVSRNFLQEDAALSRALAANNIRIYVYHLNGADLKNEVYVLAHDLPVAYGMYADDWRF
ncbi:MAG: hypothetical protein EP344_11530, partial [Bacteroidetes bacterium]